MSKNPKFRYHDYRCSYMYGMREIKKIDKLYRL